MSGQSMSRMVQHASPCHTSTPASSLAPPDPCEQAKGMWTWELAKECQECVLSMLVVGIYQPPMRLGALRLIHKSTSIKSNGTCVFEWCK